MPQNIFKLYDGRTTLWQWDTKQKLIVLDDRITDVCFSNRDMAHSKRRPVYTDSNGLRICNIPDILLQLPKNLIAYACIEHDDGTLNTVKAVKFAVLKQPIPADYVCEQDSEIEKILTKIEVLDREIKDVQSGSKEFNKFTSMVDAALWAVDNGEAGDIVVIKLDIGWVPHIIEDDKSLSAICNCDGEKIIVDVYDGGDSDGYHIFEQHEVRVWDGGGAAGY